MVSSSEIFTISNYIKFSTIPAILILLILTLLQRRAKPNKCGYQWPSLVVPMRFLDGYQDRLSYAVCFGANAAIIISVFSQTLFNGSTDSSDPGSPSANDALFCGSTNSSSICDEIWVRTVLFQIQSLLASLVCAPHFACITTHFKLIGALLGFCYSVFWTVFYIVGAVNNEKDFGAKFGTLMLLRDVPIILCFIGLCIRSVWACYQCYATKTYTVQIVDNVVEKHQVNHVVALFQKVPDEPAPSPEKLLEKIIARLKPRMFPHFRLPTRIVCIAFVQIIIIYYIGAGITVVGIALHTLLKAALQDDSLKSFTNNGTDLSVLKIFDGVYTVSFLLGTLSSIIYIVLFVINYRINLIKIYKGGKHSFLQNFQTSSKHVAQSLRLPGYQIAYIVWGFFLMSFLIFLILFFVSFGFHILIRFDLLNTAFNFILHTLSVPLSTIAVFYLQVLLVRMFLLQPKLNKEDANYPLNVNNRRLYEVVSYVLVFNNLMVGLASSLFRTCKSFVLGIIFLGRLDRCLLMKGFETMDPGYMAYVGTLLVDNAHNNPVMRAFCAILLRLTCKVNDKQNLGIRYLREPDRTCSNSRAARRWHLAYTLLHNPELLPRRKLALLLTRGMETEPDNNGSRPQPGTGTDMVSFRSSDPQPITSSRPASCGPQLKEQDVNCTNHSSFKEDNCIRLAPVLDFSEEQGREGMWAVSVKPELHFDDNGSHGGIANLNYTDTKGKSYSRQASLPNYQHYV